MLFEARAVGVVPLVRVPAIDRHLISAVPDGGALGVMAPIVETEAGLAHVEEIAAVDGIDVLWIG